MSADAAEPRFVYPLTRGETALIGVILVVACVGFPVSFATPIPSCDATVYEVVEFLKQLYPDREVSPSVQDFGQPGVVEAPSAVVLHLIRSGEPEVARRAIDFAAEKRFGVAAPYVIGRLGSDDPDLERAAQHFLRTIAGGDYGPDAGAWRAWWRDPPKNVFGWSVGWNTLKIVVTGAIALAGLSLMLIGRWRSRPPVASLGGVFLVITYFMAFVHVTISFLGTRFTCTFGSIRITYYDSPVGLEDAKVGSVGLQLLAMAAFVLVPFVLVLVYSGLVTEAGGGGVDVVPRPAADADSAAVADAPAELASAEQVIPH